MKVFVGYGYNERDRWIEEQVFPILRCMGFTVVDGKDMHGEVLEPEVKRRIEQSDAAIGFLTIRDGQGEADFNSHLWVRDELVHANAKGKPIVPVKETGVRVPEGLLGNRQYISLDPRDKLACVVELANALQRKGVRRLKLDPEDDQLRRELLVLYRTPGFLVEYRTRDLNQDSDYHQGRLEKENAAFYLNVSEVPKGALVDVQGTLNGAIKFSSGWVPADAVHVPIS